MEQFEFVGASKLKELPKTVVFAPYDSIILSGSSITYKKKNRSKGFVTGFLATATLTTSVSLPEQMVQE